MRYQSEDIFYLGYENLSVHFNNLTPPGGAIGRGGVSVMSLDPSVKYVQF